MENSGKSAPPILAFPLKGGRDFFVKKKLLAYKEIPSPLEGQGENRRRSFKTLFYQLFTLPYLIASRLRQRKNSPISKKFLPYKEIPSPFEGEGEDGGWSFIAMIYLLALVLSILVLSATATHFFLSYINSDALYLIEAAQNILQTKSLSGQNFPLAPYLFPDLIGLMLLTPLTNNITQLHYFYSCLFLATFSFILYRLFQINLKHKNYALLGTLLSIIVCFTIIAPPFSFLKDWPGSHLSVLLFSLAFLTFYLKTNINIRAFIIAYILLFLMFSSDKLLFAVLFAPMVFLISLELKRKTLSKKTALFFMLLFLLVVISEIKIEPYFFHWLHISISFNASLFRIRHFGNVDQTILHAFSLFKETIKTYPMIYTNLLLLNLGSICLAAIMHNKKKLSPSLIRTVSYLLFAEISTLVLTVLSGKLMHVAHMRYLEVIYFFPVIAFQLMTMHGILNRIYPKTLSLLNLSFILLGLYVFLKNPDTSFDIVHFVHPYPPAVQCFDTLPITQGFADYWNTRVIRMLSKKGIAITQIDKDLNRVNYLDNIRYFKSKGSWQFIIVNNLKKQRILETIGPPDRVKTCPSLEIWLYESSAKTSQLNHYFAAKKVLEYAS